MSYNPRVGVGTFPIESFGGGTTLADNGTALKNAIAAANSAGGGIILFGPGTYTFTTAPWATGLSEITLMGCGSDKTTLSINGGLGGNSTVPFFKFSDRGGVIGLSVTWGNNAFLHPFLELDSGGNNSGMFQMDDVGFVWWPTQVANFTIGGECHLRRVYGFPNGTGINGAAQWMLFTVVGGALHLTDCQIISSINPAAPLFDVTVGIQGGDAFISNIGGGPGNGQLLRIAGTAWGNLIVANVGTPFLDNGSKATNKIISGTVPQVSGSDLYLAQNLR